MATITPINTACRQNVAFKTNEESQSQKKHPVKAVASLILPGTGEMLNGDIGTGFKHLGIAAGLYGLQRVITKKMIATVLNQNKTIANKIFKQKGFCIESLKAAYKGVSKTALVGKVAIVALGIANIISSVKDAYKGKQAE